MGATFMAIKIPTYVLCPQKPQPGIFIYSLNQTKNAVRLIYIYIFIHSYEAKHRGSQKGSHGNLFYQVFPSLIHYLLLKFPCLSFLFTIMRLVNYSIHEFVKDLFLSKNYSLSVYF